MCSQKSAYALKNKTNQYVTKISKKKQTNNRHQRTALVDISALKSERW